MLVKLLGSFPKLNEDKTVKLNKHGKKIIVFKYSVHGTKEELERYKQIQGDKHRLMDDGTPMWFTTICIGETGQIGISTNDKIYPDTTKLDMAQSMIENFGHAGMIMAQQTLGVSSPTVTQQAKHTIDQATPLDE